MVTCRHCKWWRKEDSVCTEVREESYYNTPEEAERFIRAKGSSLTEFVTGPDFSCIHAEANLLPLNQIKNGWYHSRHGLIKLYNGTPGNPRQVICRIFVELVGGQPVKTFCLEPDRSFQLTSDIAETLVAVGPGDREDLLQAILYYEGVSK